MFENKDDCRNCISIYSFILKSICLLCKIYYFNFTYLTNYELQIEKKSAENKGQSIKSAEKHVLRTKSAEFENHTRIPAEINQLSGRPAEFKEHKKKYAEFEDHVRKSAEAKEHSLKTAEAKEHSQKTSEFKENNRQSAEFEEHTRNLAKDKEKSRKASVFKEHIGKSTLYEIQDPGRKSSNAKEHNRKTDETKEHKIKIKKFEEKSDCKNMKDRDLRASKGITNIIGILDNVMLEEKSPKGPYLLFDQQLKRSDFDPPLSKQIQDNLNSKPTLKKSIKPSIDDTYPTRPIHTGKKFIKKRYLSKTEILRIGKKQVLRNLKIFYVSTIFSDKRPASSFGGF